jgi:hypothetical protein
MNTVISTILIIIATAIVTESIHLSIPSWRRQLSSVIPKRERNKLVVKTAIKYPFLFIAMLLIILYVPFGKCFVVSLCFTSLIVSFFIARDIYSFGLERFIISFKKDFVKRDIESWKQQLANCDGNDKERIAMIMEKLSELEEQLGSL